MLSVGAATTPQLCAALFPKTVADVEAWVAKGKATATEKVEKLLQLPSSAINFQSAGFGLDLAEADFHVCIRVLSVTKNTSTDKDLRDAATKSIVDLESFGLDLFDNNKRLYEVVKQLEPQADGLEQQERYWLTETLQAYRRRGLELPDDKLAEVSAVQKTIQELTTAFSRNIAEDKTTIRATEDELAGVPSTVVSGLKKDDDGKFVLGLDYPTYFGVMRNCEVAETRKRHSEAFDSRAADTNMPVLHELVAQRHKLALLLGFPSYAHYDTASKMSKTPDVARKFCEDLVPGLLKKWDQEYQVLLQDLHPSVVLSEGKAFQQYDVAFVMDQYKKKHLNVDETKIQEYFPLETTIEALFKIYEAFFDVRFQRYSENIFWHEEVTTLGVYKKAGDVLIGHLVLDLFPRDGKYTHACHHTVLPPVKNADGTFSPALSVVLANFPKATEDKPPLFQHSDAKTFFHEFGHGIHALMGRTNMPTCAGTQVKRDFVELPSQMLECWLWEPSILKMVTSHYKTKEPLPQELIDAKVRSRDAFSGRDVLRQLWLSLLSLDIFCAEFASQPKEAMNSTALMVERQRRLTPNIVYSDDQKYQCRFGHLTGYGACYYGYRWSEVFAADVFNAIAEADGLLSAEMGRKYVDCIIGRGGSQDPTELLRMFLGRDPTPDAFIKKLGL